MVQEIHKVTIVFTDVEGYTSMMHKDESSTVELVSQLQTLQKNEINNAGGTVVKELGDGLLAYFEDPSTAVECMILVQKLIAQAFDTRIRVGMHESEVVFSGDDILGDGVNIASRIEPLTDPGGIYISEALSESTHQNNTFSSRLLGKAQIKGVEERIDIYAVIAEGLPEPSLTRFNKLANPRKKFAIIPTLIVFAVIVAAALFSTQYFENRARVSEAEASVLHVRELVRTNWRDFSEAYYLAKQVEQVIPENEQLLDLINKSSVRVNITTNPTDADVYYKIFREPDSEWYFLGKTPIDSAQLPKCAVRWKIEKEGYVTAYAASQSTTFGGLTAEKLLVGQDFHRDLFKTDELPENMVYVPEAVLPYGTIPSFYIDKYEVTNVEYKEFMDQGGYEKDEYWSALIDYSSDSLDWREVRRNFSDMTGQPGPATWINGTYPVGQERHPVSGVSWYEALAFAEFAEKDIPTKDHWALAYGRNLNIVSVHQLGGSAIFAPFRNFQSDGSWEVGSSPGIDPYGTYDMGGNVREWCWNKSVMGQWMRGGSWVDNHYMGRNPSQAPPLDRSATNGFRCVTYIDRSQIPDHAFDFQEERIVWHFDTLPEPLSEKEFEFISELYDYDDNHLDEVIEWTEAKEDWTLEKVTFNAAYNNERIMAYLFIPREVSPPYQTVVYGYGSGAFMWRTSEDIERYFEFPAFLEFIARSGRAVVLPVVKGTFERGDENSLARSVDFGGHTYTEFMTHIVKDYRRTVDYLETREDIDMDRLCFYGMSYGPLIGHYLTAVDDRFDTNIYYAGGMTAIGRPESNQAHFLPRVTIPTLMINGKYDANFRMDYEVKYMYELLGTPKEEKKLLLFESDHLAPRADVVREIQIWLDSHFGLVNNQTEFASTN